MVNEKFSVGTQLLPLLMTTRRRFKSLSFSFPSFLSEDGWRPKITENSNVTDEARPRYYKPRRLWAQFWATLKIRFFLSQHTHSLLGTSVDTRCSSFLARDHNSLREVFYNIIFLRTKFERNGHCICSWCWCVLGLSDCLCNTVAIYLCFCVVYGLHGSTDPFGPS